MLSPYVESVNVPLLSAFAAAGLETAAFATFAEAEEAKVARIATQSIVDGATDLAKDSCVQGIFLSCTNLKTHRAISQIAEITGKPVFSSNSALAWHMRRLAET